MDSDERRAASDSGRGMASEPGWPLCVKGDSGHSKFLVLREPGLSDSESESGHGVTAWACLALVSGVSLAVQEERGNILRPRSSRANKSI